MDDKQVTVTNNPLTNEEVLNKVKKIKEEKNILEQNLKDTLDEIYSFIKGNLTEVKGVTHDVVVSGKLDDVSNEIIFNWKEDNRKEDNNILSKCKIVYDKFNQTIKLRWVNSIFDTYKGRELFSLNQVQANEFAEFNARFVVQIYDKNNSEFLSLVTRVVLKALELKKLIIEKDTECHSYDYTLNEIEYNKFVMNLKNISGIKRLVYSGKKFHGTVLRITNKAVVISRPNRKWVLRIDKRDVFNAVNTGKIELVVDPQKILNNKLRMI